MIIPDYKVGDLVVLKQILWKDNIKRVGVITELMFKSSINEKDVSFFVMFENAHPLVKNRIVWHTDVEEYYPVVK